MLTVKFETGEIIKGTAWKGLPNERITVLKYRTEDTIILLTGFESYNHLIEKVCVPGGIPVKTKLLLIGRHSNLSYIVTYDFKTGKIDENIVPNGQEYNGQVVSGWKNGVKEDVPMINYINPDLH